MRGMTCMVNSKARHCREQPRLPTQGGDRERDLVGAHSDLDVGPFALVGRSAVGRLAAARHAVDRRRAKFDGSSLAPAPAGTQRREIGLFSDAPKGVM